MVVGLGVLPTEGEAQASTSPQATGVATVLAGSLNVRRAPNLDGAIVTSVQRGDTVCVLGRDDDWLRIRTRVVVGANEGDTETEPSITGPVDGFAARGFLSERQLSADQLRAAGCGG